MQLSRTKALILIGIVIGFVAVPVLGALTGTSPISDGVELGAPDGANITVGGDADVQLETPFPSSDTVEINTSAHGNITFTSAGPASATVDADNITGTYTNLTAINTTVNDLTVNPEDKYKTTIGGNIDTFAYKSKSQTQVDDGVVDFVYKGSSGTSTVTIKGIPSNTQIAAIDKQTTAVLEVATSGGSGTVTFNSLDNSKHNVVLQTSAGGPNLDDASMSPDGTQFRKSGNIDFSIDVDDADYPNENITLEWYVNGQKKKTTFATSKGTKTVTIKDLETSEGQGTHDWHVEATDSYGATDTSATKQFSLNYFETVISQIAPNGTLDSNPTQITAQINDTDFGTVGDTVTVEFNLDGSQIASTTVTSNGTVSTSMPSSGQLGGDHSITVNATDRFSQFEADSAAYRVPATLFVRNETDHSQLVAANGGVTFVSTDETIKRSSGTGKLDLTNFPVTSDIIAEIEPTNDDYTERTVYIESIYEQESAYVLNTSQNEPGGNTAINTVASRFELNDPTGEYGSQTVLKIKKPISIGGNIAFRTIMADRFGVEGVTATLDAEERYQLYVATVDQEQLVGPYRAEASETVEVVPGSPNLNLSTENRTVGYDAVLNNDTLTFGYSDPQNETLSLTVFVHERGNKSNQLAPNTTFIDIGTATGTLSLTKEETKTEWVVKFDADRGDDEFVKRINLFNRRALSLPIAPGWQSMLAVGSLVLLAGAFSILNAGVGAVVVSLAGGLLWFIGFLGTATSGAAIVVALFISIVGHMLSSQR